VLATAAAAARQKRAPGSPLGFGGSVKCNGTRNVMLIRCMARALTLQDWQ
jgi:hypothetical protein